MTNRIEQLRHLMEQRAIDAVALVPGANLYYMTGLRMHLSERITLALITREGDSYMLAPTLEIARIESLLRVPMKLFPWSDAEGSRAAWKNLGENLVLNGRTIGIEPLAMRVLELGELEMFAPGFRVADGGDLVSELRLVKDEDEIQAMRSAAQVIDKSLTNLLGQIKPGMTEKDVASRWQLAMREAGADGIPDEPIVAGGPNSASPHTTATDRPIDPGELVIPDGWCTVNSYYTDITRTVAIGVPPDNLRQIYEVTALANKAGRQASRQGATGEEVDRAARQVITEAGFGQYFLHRTGHGLGLEVHEPPFMVEGYARKLAPGMTFTVEPGIYLTGQGGARIEDDVLISQDGCESLTKFDHQLIVL